MMKCSVRTHGETAPGMPALPASSLFDASGAELAQKVSPGAVTTPAAGASSLGAVREKAAAVAELVGSNPCQTLAQF